MKYIYLDEWCWINIGKAQQNQKINQIEDYLNFITLAKENVANNIWAFPLSIWHLEENRNIGREERRKHIAQIKQKLSNNWTSKSFHHIREDEIYCALNGIKLQQNNVIKQNVLNMFDTKHHKVVDEYLLEENIALDEPNNQKLKKIYEIIGPISSFSTMAAEYSDLDSMKSSQTSCLEAWRELHRQNSLTEYEVLLRNLECYYNNYQQEVILKELQPLISNLSKEEARIEIVKFFKLFPSFYTGSMLIYELVKSQDKTKAFHKNDFIDITFLTVAIPYFDVVVTERRWQQYAKQQQLDKIYSTEIYKSIKDI